MLVIHSQRLDLAEIYTKDIDLRLAMAANPVVNEAILPAFNLIMPLLRTTLLASIKRIGSKLEPPFSYNKSMGKFLDTVRQLIP